eukprot:scaffold178688_cov15-Tisochrysis_lutea.AAC.1
MVQMKKSAPISSHDSHPSPQAAPPSTFCQANISTARNRLQTSHGGGRKCPSFLVVQEIVERAQAAPGHLLTKAEILRKKC